MLLLIKLLDLLNYDKLKYKFFKNYVYFRKYKPIYLKIVFFRP